MEGNTYKNLKAVEIVEYLCQGSANGFSEGAIEALEKKLGLLLPGVLRDFLLRAGRERICVGEEEMFSLDYFRVQEGYLVIGKMDGRNARGVLWKDITIKEKHSMEEEHSMEEKHSIEEEHSMEEKYSMEEEHSVEEETSMEEEHSMEGWPSMDNPPVYLQDAEGKWDIYAESMEDCLLAEVDRRIRRTKISAELEPHMEHLERYFYCKYLLCREWTRRMKPSEVFVPQEAWEDIFPEKGRAVGPWGGEERDAEADWEDEEEDSEEDWEDEEDDGGEDWDDEEDDGEEDWDKEDWNEEDDWDEEQDRDGVMGQYFCGKYWVCPRELKNMLLEKKVTLPDCPYSIAVCLEMETGILFSACFPREERRFVSLLQVSGPRAVCLQNSLAGPEAYYAERLLDHLAEEVHAPVMAHCLAEKNLLPENVRGLAEEELHRWIADTIGSFLKLFESNRSWKLGVRVSDKFIDCSGRMKQREAESLLDLWYGHHLKADAPVWTPSFVRKTKEKEAAPEGLEPLIKELIYRVHDYNLLNRYAFLAGKIVTKEGFSVRIQNYTKEERFALLSFYREMMDGVTERIFDCLERKVFSVRIKGKDFISLCGNPMTHLEGWINQYEREELSFLEEGCWR